VWCAGANKTQLTSQVWQQLLPAVCQNVSKQLIETLIVSEVWLVVRWRDCRGRDATRTVRQWWWWRWYRQL